MVPLARLPQWKRTARIGRPPLAAEFWDSFTGAVGVASGTTAPSLFSPDGMNLKGWKQNVGVTGVNWPHLAWISALQASNVHAVQNQISLNA
jgi:hypothetical protein